MLELVFLQIIMLEFANTMINNISGLLGHWSISRHFSRRDIFRDIYYIITRGPSAIPPSYNISILVMGAE